MRGGCGNEGVPITPTIRTLPGLLKLSSSKNNFFSYTIPTPQQRHFDCVLACLPASLNSTGEYNPTKFPSNITQRREGQQHSSSRTKAHKSRLNLPTRDERREATCWGTTHTLTHASPSPQACQPNQPFTSTRPA